MTTARTLQPEDVIAHYKVVGPLGAGGMGEVYLAQDQSLERNVALKVLPAEYVQDDERLRRFVLEAKSASSLSHPNIVTIYEIGRDVVRSKGGAVEPDSGPMQYISMELITGRTLSTLIHEEKTDLRTLIGYLAQAAEGLAKAHAAGIVHRDLKPGNIMVSADGFAKILDFGLAKLTERRDTDPEPDLSSAPTRVEQRTGAGMILGTTAYMSPEQVRGKPVDHRSDIFSFGCVLYEAATRTRPFVAETAVETMHKILHDTPVPIEERNAKTPGELRRLVRRCLAKNPDQRLQSMKDIALELREIADEWDALSSSSATTATAARHPGESAPKSKMPLVLGAVGLLAVAAVMVSIWAVRRAPVQEPAQPFQTMRMATQTSRGDVTEAAISRDGRYLAYLTGDVGKASVRVLQVATGSDLEVVPSEEGIFQGLSFSPDGNYLFYGKRRRDAPNYSALMQVPSLGGPSRERAFDVDSRVTFSPDAKSIAFFRGEPQNARALIVVRELDGGAERVLATVASPRQIVAAPAWSPNGRLIAIADFDTSSGSFIASVAAYDVTTGAREEIETFKGGLPESLAWLPDGGGIVRAGYELGTSVNRQIALVDYPKRGTRRITNDASDYQLVSVSAGDEAIAAVRSNRLSDLWLVDPSGAEPRPITSFRNPENSPFGVDTCPDGSVLFSASRDQSLQVWSTDTAGGPPKPVISGRGLALNARCLSGGLLFDLYDDEGAAHVWRADADGGNVKMLTPGPPSQIVDLSRDGRVAVFNHLGDRDLWSVSVPDGASRKIWHRAEPGKISPDASRVLVSDIVPGADGLIHRELKIVPAAGGAAVNGPAIPVRSDAMNWSPDGAAVTFVDQTGSVWNVYRAPLGGGAPQAVTKFKDGRITNYQFSPDGKQLAVALTVGTATNVWVSAADGSKPVQATRFPMDDIFDMRWTADGKHLVVNAGRRSADAVLIRNFR